MKSRFWSHVDGQVSCDSKILSCHFYGSWRWKFFVPILIQILPQSYKVGVDCPFFLTVRTILHIVVVQNSLLLWREQSFKNEERIKKKHGNLPPDFLTFPSFAAVNAPLLSFIHPSRMYTLMVASYRHHHQ